MSAPAAIDIDHLRGWVGREQVQDEVIAGFPARALAALLERAPPPRTGDALALPWHWMHFLETPAWSELDADGHPRRGGFLPPVPLPRRMWAAGRVERHAPLVIGEPARKHSRVESVSRKDGQSGPLVFVTVRHRLLQRGVLCIDERQDLVYREAPLAAAPLPPGEPAPPGEFERTLVPDAALLSRYSALTYNGHRIHLDRAYAVGEEFYPGLVVHAPLLATLLLDLLARERPALAVRALSFRAVRPAFDGAALALAGRIEPAGAQLWTRDAAGFIGMKADVEFE